LGQSGTDFVAKKGKGKVSNIGSGKQGPSNEVYAIDNGMVHAACHFFVSMTHIVNNGRKKYLERL